MEKEIDIGGYKVSSMVVMVGTGIIAMIIFYYFFSSSSSAASGSTSASSGLSSELAAYEQYAAQQAQISQATQASTQQYSLGMAQLQDQLAATQSTNQAQLSAIQSSNNAANQQAAMAAGSSMANGLTMLGANNTSALLQAVSNTYAANYAAGTDIAQTALNAAGTSELAGLSAMTTMQNSANASLGNIALAQNNTLSNLFTSIGGTTASVTQANAAWQPQSWQVCGHYAIAGGCAGTSNGSGGGNGAGS